MAELIDRGALYRAFYERECDMMELDGILGVVANFPTIDAVQVVRCENCRHSSKIANSTKGERHCWSLRGRNNGDGFSRVRSDGYCDDGERRKEQNNG